MIALDAVICLAIFLRVVFYRRAGARYRPVASLLAYAIAVAAGWVVILAALGLLAPIDPATVALHAVLALALFAARGNVVEIFHTSDVDNWIHRWIRKEFFHDRDAAQG